MATSTRGRCVVCDQRRVLRGEICRECCDDEDRVQRDHLLGQRVEAAGAESYSQWSARTDQWTETELKFAAENGTLSEYIEKAYRMGFWLGAYSMKDIEADQEGN